MTRGLDTPLEIALGVVEPTKARYMEVIHDKELSAIVALGRSAFTHKVRIVYGYTLC